jgi:hypothetical protein
MIAVVGGTQEGFKAVQISPVTVMSAVLLLFKCALTAADTAGHAFTVQLRVLFTAASHVTVPAPAPSTSSEDTSIRVTSKCWLPEIRKRHTSLLLGLQVVLRVCGEKVTSN